MGYPCFIEKESAVKIFKPGEVKRMIENKKPFDPSDIDSLVGWSKTDDELRATESNEKTVKVKIKFVEDKGGCDGCFNLNNCPCLPCTPATREDGKNGIWVIDKIEPA